MRKGVMDGFGSSSALISTILRLFDVMNASAGPYQATASSRPFVIGANIENKAYDLAD